MLVPIKSSSHSSCLIAASALILFAQMTGCSKSEKSPKPAPLVIELPEIEEKKVSDAEPSIEHLKVNGVITEWGRKPKLNWNTAIMLAKMSKLAYEDSATRTKVLNENGFDKVLLLDDGSHSGFVAIKGDIAVISFRGTDDKYDWIANGRFNHIPEIDSDRATHDGFRDAYMKFSSEIREQLSENNSKQVWITGHSLGGAMATCCAYQFLRRDLPITGVVTFGQPRIGNEELADYLEKELGDRYLRFINEKDIVPRLPPSIGNLIPPYWHSGRRVWFKDGGLKTIKGLTPMYSPMLEAREEIQQREPESQDSFESMSEDDFLKLQQQLKMMQTNQPPILGLQELATDSSKMKMPMSSGKYGRVIDFFYDYVGDHGMDKYLEQLRGQRKGNATKISGN